MEDIKLSILNGQHRQAIQQIKNSNYAFEDVIRSITEDEFLGCDVALRVLRMAIHTGYIQFHDDYDD